MGGQKPPGSRAKAEDKGSSLNEERDNGQRRSKQHLRSSGWTVGMSEESQRLSGYSGIPKLEQLDMKGHTLKTCKTLIL